MISRYFLLLILVFCDNLSDWQCTAYTSTLYRPSLREDYRHYLLYSTKTLPTNTNYYHNLSTKLFTTSSSAAEILPINDHSNPQNNNNRSSIFPSITAFHRLTSSWHQLRRQLSNQWQLSVKEFKTNPLQFISIPIVAAIVGYVTNYIGVWMLFNPVEWKGIPIKRWAGQPLGLIGWQGVVPTKRFIMSQKMVDVTINKLLSIKEVFQQLNILTLSNLFTKMLQPKIYSGLLPVAWTNSYMQKIIQEIIQNIEKIVDLRQIVVKKMTTDPTVLGCFFQQVGKQELQFLITSGTYFGFLLGIVQMFQWMIYPKPWTLPVGGAIVGYITNWIALKWIFEPLYPQRVGPFIVQGLFLKRQREVTNEFVTYMTTKVLYSQELWRSILLNPKNYQQFLFYLQTNLPTIFFPKELIATIGTIIKENLLAPSSASGGSAAAAATAGTAIGASIHQYIDKTLQLKSLLIQRMNALSPKEFEQILHPVFQEDELTLIVAGGILGMLAGAGQMLFNDYLERRKQKQKKLPEESKERTTQLLSTSPPPAPAPTLLTA